MTHRRYSSLLAVSIAVLAFFPSAVIAGQQPQPTSPDTSDRLQFTCLDDGLTRPGSTGFGCQRLAAYPITGSLDTPLYWHIIKVPTGTLAVPGNVQRASVVEADGQQWLYSFGPKDAVPAQGEHVISIGPLPLRPANGYQVVAYFVVMPVGTHTTIHTHPGPEAWYVLAGAQCLDTPRGAMKLAAGEGGVVPPDTPMRLHNSGTSTRRALFIVIHDPALRWGSPVEWTPTGACER